MSNLKTIMLAVVIIILATGAEVLSQMPERQGKMRGPQEDKQVWEVFRIDERILGIKGSDGSSMEVMLSERTSFVRDKPVDKGSILKGDTLLLVGKPQQDERVSPMMIKILTKGVEMASEMGDAGSRRSPIRNEGKGGRQQGPMTGLVTELTPLTIEMKSGERKVVEITEMTRIIKEFPIDRSDIKPGQKVRITPPPGQMMGQKEAKKVALQSEETAQPGRTPVQRLETKQSDLLPNIPQQPVNADFIYSAWIGRGLYSNTELDRAFKVARNLGVKHLKVEFKWNSVEPINNEFVWNNSNKLDVEHVIKLAREYNMAIIPYFEPFMPWGEKRFLDRDKGECEGPPSRLGQVQAPDPAEYAEYVFAVVDKLRKAGIPVVFVEMDNETTNISDGYHSWNCFINMTAKQVKEVQNAAYDKIKAAYPDIMISSTTFSFPGTMANKPDIIEKDRKRKNSLVSAYFAEEPRPKFDFLAIHEVLGGSGNPYTTLDASKDASYRYNFGSYNDAYDLWRMILDSNGYKAVPIINTESGAIISGRQDAQLLQRIIFARANAARNKIKGWVLSQISGSGAFTAGGEMGGNITVGITKLADGYSLREGYYGFYTMMKTIVNYPVYEGMVMGGINSRKPVVEKFSDRQGSTLYAVFIPYSGSGSTALQDVSLKIIPNRNVKATKSDATTMTMQTNSSGYLNLTVDEHPVFIEVINL